MSVLREKFVERAIIYGAVFTEVSCPIFTQNEQDLTLVSLTQLQGQVLVLPTSRLRFVLAPCISEAKVTQEGLAVKGTEQI